MIWISGAPDRHLEAELAAPDGTVIPYRAWETAGARAAICYLHGQGDHSGPFTAMGDHLHACGFNVYAHDQRGFGRSREPRGHIDTYDRFINDALHMAGHAGAANPGRPLFLLGHSMGGHIAFRTAARAGRRLRGVIALSPGFKLRRTPLKGLVQTLAWLVVDPRRPMPSVAAGVPTTRNQVHCERAAADEHYVTHYTAKFYLEALRSVRRAYADMARVQVPALVLMSGEDHLVCDQTARRYFERIAHPDKEFRLLPGLMHNLVAEPEMPQVAQMVAEWITGRCADAVDFDPCAG